MHVIPKKNIRNVIKILSFTVDINKASYLSTLPLLSLETFDHPVNSWWIKVLPYICFSSIFCSTQKYINVLRTNERWVNDEISCELILYTDSLLLDQFAHPQPFLSLLMWEVFAKVFTCRSLCCLLLSRFSQAFSKRRLCVFQPYTVMKWCEARRGSLVVGQRWSNGLCGEVINVASWAHRQLWQTSVS